MKLKTEDSDAGPVYKQIDDWADFSELQPDGE